MRPNLQVIDGGLSRKGNISTRFGNPVSVAPADAVAFALPVFAAHKRNLAGWLRNLVELRRAQGKPVELNYGLCRELADLLEFGGDAA